MTLLSEELRKKHDVKFFSFKRQYPLWLYPGTSDRDTSRLAVRDGQAEAVLDSLNPLTWIGTYSRIRKFDPDLVIIPWWVAFWTPQFWTISRLIRRNLKAKLLFICHNVVEHESNSIKKFCTKLVLKNGTHFIVHCEEDLKNLRDIIPQANAVKSFHPIYDAFKNKMADKKQAQKQLSLSGNVILFFGFIRPYKGLKYLLEAMPDVLSQIDVTLLVVGEFWKDKKQYIEQIGRLGLNDRVVVVDKYVPNEDVGRYFAACDVVVLPYVSATGSGIAQLAYGFEKPVISTRTGSLGEIVIDGKTGFLAEPGDSESLAASIVDFYQNEMERGFIDNIKKENKRFSWSVMAEKIEQLCGLEQ